MLYCLCLITCLSYRWRKRTNYWSCWNTEPLLNKPRPSFANARSCTYTVTQHVTNAEISARNGLPPVMDFIRRRRLSAFGHIARLTQGTPAHNALHCQVGLASGRSLGRDWRRHPGRPRACWTDQLNDTGSVPANLWRQAILWGHGGPTRRPELATRWRRRRPSFLELIWVRLDSWRRNVWMLCSLYVIVGMPNGDWESKQTTGVVRSTRWQNVESVLWMSLSQCTEEYCRGSTPT